MSGHSIPTVAPTAKKTTVSTGTIHSAIPKRFRVGVACLSGRPRFPQAADLLEDAAEDLLAHLHYPREHRRRLHSTNPLERLHKEIKRRTNVVGIFPNRTSLVRMVATLLQEQDDEWQVADRRYISAGSMAHIDELGGGDTPRELLAAIA
jgi:hypothetical protein